MIMHWEEAILWEEARGYRIWEGAMALLDE